MTTKPAPMENGAGGGNRRRGGRWWYAAASALLVALVAVAVSSRSFPGTPSSPGGCGCHAARKYTGMVEDCCCDYETVDSINEEVLHPTLQELVKLPFFRYFKVKLWCDCPFWPDDGMCRLRDCSVCECPDNEFPEPFKKPYSGLSPDSMICQEGKPQAAVDKTLDTKVFKGWVETDNPWTSDDETDNNEMTYVNLQLNPERYTGYTGDSARRIWDSIYKENCPKYPSEELCHEKKALYKLISGLHSSISVHIAYDYLLDESTNLWGQNLPLLYDRVLKYPERVQNLYFTYLFVLRAVTKAADYLEQAEYNTGNPEDDLKTQSLVKQLLYHPKLRSACPKPFDEAKLWQGENGPELKQEIQKQFRNISAIMDCVGCEKCRLWGKLQVLAGRRASRRGGAGARNPASLPPSGAAPSFHRLPSLRRPLAPPSLPPLPPSSSVLAAIVACWAAATGGGPLPVVRRWWRGAWPSRPAARRPWRGGAAASAPWCSGNGAVLLRQEGRERRASRRRDPVRSEGGPARRSRGRRDGGRGTRQRRLCSGAGGRA